MALLKKNLCETNFLNTWTDMFGSLFGKTTPKEKLEKKYRKLLEESHRMSTSNRAKSDQLRAEAEEVLKEIESL